jgi:hypothetical protein
MSQQRISPLAFSLVEARAAGKVGARAAGYVISGQRLEKWLVGA